VKATRRLLAPMTLVTLDLYRYFRVRMSTRHDLLLDSARPVQGLSGPGPGRRPVGWAHRYNIGRIWLMRNEEDHI
jgi:hypothetical protein